MKRSLRAEEEEEKKWVILGIFILSAALSREQKSINLGCTENMFLLSRIRIREQ